MSVSYTQLQLYPRRPRVTTRPSPAWNSIAIIRTQLQLHDHQPSATSAAQVQLQLHCLHATIVAHFSLIMREKWRRHKKKKRERKRKTFYVDANWLRNIDWDLTTPISMLTLHIYFFLVIKSIFPMFDRIYTKLCYSLHSVLKGGRRASSPWRMHVGNEIRNACNVLLNSLIIESPFFWREIIETPAKCSHDQLRGRLKHACSRVLNSSCGTNYRPSPTQRCLLYLCFHLSIRA